MHVIVLGAGVVGVTSAYYLAERGCRVTIIDRADDVAMATSHANGAQLSYSFTESLAGHGFFARLPGLLSGSDRAIRVRLTPGLVPWGLRFLAQCTTRRARDNTLRQLTTARRSAALLSELRQQIDLEFAFRPAGKLVMLANADEVRVAEDTTALKRRHGVDIEMLTAAEALDVEPTLAAVRQPIKAAVFSRTDEVGDAYLFARGLRQHLERSHDVRFLLGHEAHRIVLSDNGAAAVLSDQTIDADAVVVCTGAWSQPLLRKHGIDPKIYPVRGYSVTLPAGPSAPSVSLTSLNNRFVMTRLNGRIRIAGFTDFDGFNTASDATRIRTLVDTARQVAPDAAEFNSGEMQPWGGFRPMTPSGRPVVGATKAPGIYLNTGHGMLGWTLACATAEAVADAVVTQRA